jgi:hypothetical protein
MTGMTQKPSVVDLTLDDEEEPNIRMNGTTRTICRIPRGETKVTNIATTIAALLGAGRHAEI